MNEIESPNNACQHRLYCMGLQNKLGAITEQAIEKGILNNAEDAWVNSQAWEKIAKEYEQRTVRAEDQVEALNSIINLALIHIGSEQARELIIRIRETALSD